MAENLPRRPARKPASPPPVALADPPPAPPSHLSDEAADMWRDITEKWLIGPDALPLLRAGLESWDLYQRCREEVSRDGPTVSTGQGMIRQHPAARVGTDALTAFRQCFRQLGLEPPE